MRLNLLAGAITLLARGSLIEYQPFNLQPGKVPPPNPRNDNAASRQRVAKKRRKARSKRK